MTATEYHYILTMQRPAPGGGFEIADGCGTLTVPADGTRAGALDYLVGMVAEDRGWRPGEGTILLFCLEPNRLGGER